MKKMTIFAVAALLVGPVSTLAPQVAHAGPPSDTGTPDQTSLDTADPNMATWPSLLAGWLAE